ncbi:MAG: DUF2188 domain-containing protein [Clostridiaceae bacterium]|nr:DUF2188 domain-containing protein [Clostridiaceae bacterium]
MLEYTKVLCKTKNRKEGDFIKKDQHVVPHNGKWAVRGAGNEKVTSVHNTQKDAISAARSIAMNQKSEVVIHKKDGTIRDKDSYGPDPNPPKDKKY